MIEYLQPPEVKQKLLNIMARVMQAKDELNEMDSRCGDGDFGTTMQISFSSAREQLNELVSNDIGIMFVTTGQAILSSAGGTAGPIFGSFFIEAGQVAKGKSELDLSDLAAMFEASLTKIKRQGGARVGDKTVVDALEPAVSSMQEGATHNTALLQGLRNAASAARIGSESTKRIIARRGKARYLGEQTLGYVDPGAYVIATIFELFARSQDSE